MCSALPDPLTQLSLAEQQCWWLHVQHAWGTDKDAPPPGHARDVRFLLRLPRMIPEAREAMSLPARRGVGLFLRLIAGRHGGR